MVKLRKLTAKESVQFQSLCKEDALLACNLDAGDFASGEILADIEIDPDREFDNKLQLGAYLYEKLGGVSSVDNEVWHFLVIVYHRQLLKNGKIGQTDRFYIDPQKPYYPFTHLLKPVFDVYRFYHDKQTPIDFLLLNPVNESGRLFLETVKRQDIMKNENFIQASRSLFYDEENKKIKTGIEDDFLRLIALLKQYERTYDLYSMPAERILKNLIARHDQFHKYNLNPTSGNTEISD